MGYRHAAARKFDAESVSAKVGTQPMLIRLDGRCKIEKGKRIRWKERLGERKWNTGIVDNVEPLRIERW